jgi:hypothetical protein
MGTASISEIRDGIKTRLSTVLNLNCYDTIEMQIETPAAVVEPGAGSFDMTMGRGSDAMDFIIGLAVGGGVDRVSQDTLDGYLSGWGATSIKVAMETDPTLGGIVSYAKVRGWRNYGTSTKVNGVPMWGADVLVEVVT